MVMCHLGYKEMAASDFGSWPEWVNAVNNNSSYCAALPRHRVREHRFKVRSSALPSFHPYWRMMVHRDAMCSGQRHVRNLIECERDNSRIKYLYNSSTSLQDIRRMVSTIPKRRQDW